MIRGQQGATRWIGLSFLAVSVASVFRDGAISILPVVRSFSLHPLYSEKVRFLVDPSTKTPQFHRRTLFQQSIQDGDTTNNSSSNDGDEDDVTPTFNPYADPNYPDLEFVNYDDPEYSIDRSLSAAENDITDETLLEQMREERRVANDEYQYNTYWHTVWNAGMTTYRGEWTVYYSSNFFPQFDDDDEEEEDRDSHQAAIEDNANSLPHLIQLSEAPLTVISRAIMQSGNADSATSTSYITHVEQLEEGMGDVDLAMAGGADEVEQQVVSQTYWPTQLSQADFRGHQGIMICGKYVSDEDRCRTMSLFETFLTTFNNLSAYTICDAVPLISSLVNDEEEDEDSSLIGPFKEYRVELGICANDEARFRIKLDYNVLNNLSDFDILSPPPLHLKTMVVCRESANVWPRSSAMARSLFGTQAGAPGGLYDPPIVGSASEKYCQVDLDGSATALFPVIIDQGDFNESFEGLDAASSQDDRVGWVTSLDWTAGDMRYQVDRKVHSGRHLRGLRTLELSEVQGVDADKYRPRDGGQNMRQ